VLRLALVLATILLVSYFVNNEAFALSCAGPTWEEEFEQADIVFVGLVTEKKYDTPDVAISTLLVKEVSKGSPSDTVKIKSDERNWGIFLTEGWSYQIFAKDEGDFLSVDICTRSGAVEPIPPSENDAEDYAKRAKMMMEIILMENKPSPLKQLQRGVYHSDIICNSDLVLIGKIDGSPVCVKQKSIAKLVERGWANSYYAPSIDSFEECAAAGNPVMESYPRQCRTADGKHFVETIP